MEQLVNSCMAPGQIGEHGPLIPLHSHVDGHTKVYFLITIN